MINHTADILKNAKECLASINASNMIEKDQVYEIFEFLPKNCSHFSFSVSSFHPFFYNPYNPLILTSFHSNQVFLYLPSFHSSMLPSFHSFCPFILLSSHRSISSFFRYFHVPSVLASATSSHRSILFFQW